MKRRTGQTEEVRRPDQKGLQSYVSRHLGRGEAMNKERGEEGGRAEIFILVITQMLLSQVTAERGKK